MQRGLINILSYITICITLFSCSITKYVPEDKYLLNKVKVTSDSKQVNTEMLYDYIKQTPNSYFLGIGRAKLSVYNMSSDDSTKKINRWLKKIGEAPVIYDATTTKYSQKELEKVLFNNGYMNSVVSTNVKLNDKKKKANVVYNVSSKTPYTVRSFLISIPNDTAASLIYSRKKKKDVSSGDLFNVDKLDKERENVAKRLRNNGYYNFGKELLFYAVDTSLGKNQLDIELSLQPHILENDSALDVVFERKYIDNIIIYAFKDNRLSVKDKDLDTFKLDKYTVYTEKGYKTFRPKAIINKIAIKPGQYYKENNIEQTYSILNSLEAIKYVNISFTELQSGNLQAQIIISQEKPHSISGEFEFTYSGGNFGAKLSAGYQNNNIFNGSETLKIGVSGGYEMLGKVSESQYAAEISSDIYLKFPRLLFPFNNSKLGKNANINTEFGVNVNFQKRPEYERNIANAGIKYSWSYKRINFNYNLIDISYIYLPVVSEDFKDKYLNPTSSIRYSYEDHFIMRMGLGLSTTNQRGQTNNYYTLRANFITAGNLLYGLSNLFNQSKNEDGYYKIFNIQYSQYIKADIDYSYNILFNQDTRLIFHGGFGIAIPYGNASILPFEERYYSGGANSVRGWGIRTLGPGNFRNSIGAIDFMRQSGDIKLDLNLESRFKLFWKLEGAVFLDAGNIWTIVDYKEQPGGYFKFDKFYEQIALSYGIGIRANFSFFILRLDMGIKLYDPSYALKNDRWRTTLNWGNDVAIHFAVGYPF